jgi:hypothetical protein
MRNILNRTRIRPMTWLMMLSITMLLGTSPAIAGHSPAGGCIEAIELSEIVDGRKQKTIISAEELAQPYPLSSRGYITEIILHCTHDGVSAEIASESPTAANRLRVTKKVVPQDRWTRSATKPSSLTIVPKITGDCLSPDDELTVAVTSTRAGAFDLKFRQKGYRQVYEAPQDCTPRSQPLVIRYLGKEIDQFDNPEAQERFEALAAGVRKIEQAYGQELVHSVNIIGLEGHNNALSLKDKNEIWLYADTFWGYETGELRSMASHETLHVFVDAANLTEKPEIRELFADLMGFNPKSRERTALVTTGYLPRGYAARHKSQSPFWGFINERHFIDGMSGGHSSDNIDEFCTSFLHSLLFSEHLEYNLDKPIVINGRRSARVLKSEDRDHLLHQYRQAVKVFRSAAPEATPVKDVCAVVLERIDRLSSPH